VSIGGNIDESYSISNELLCWKYRIYVPNGLRQRVIQSEYNSKVAGYFGRECIQELVSRNFDWTNMERDIRKYCNEFDICQRTDAPRHIEYSLLHPLELA
jgi:hypothetical protein